MNITILARIGEFDIELSFETSEGYGVVAGIISGMQEVAPEIKPRPRFQNNQPKVAMPFIGTIESTELVPAKDGKREFCLAHVVSPDGEKVDVRYFPPLKTWRAGEKATVQKGQYGPELKEVEDNAEPPF
jgi:hypothetical protein